MDKNESFDLSKFDSYREDNRMEVKKAKGGLPTSLWETYSSFANTSGGVIILGVKEEKDGSWKTSGLNEEDEGKLIKEFWNNINNSDIVSVNLLSEKDVKTYRKDGNLIICIFVPRAKRELKPVYIKNDMFLGSFKRNGEGDYRCTRLQVKSMLRDQDEETMDMRIVSRFGLDVLNPSTITAYRNNHKYARQVHPWVDLPDEEYLERIGAAKIGEDGKYHPTCAGLLMFGTEPKILYEYPDFFLDYQEIMALNVRWTERIQSMSGDWSGNLYEFYFRVYNRIQQYVKTPFKLEGLYRVDDTPVHKALREALLNCLSNADFFVPRGVVIKMDRNKLTLENPGSIRVGKDQLFKGGVSDPRNKAIMKMFSLLDIGERAGSGFSEILNTWKKEKWPTPVVEESDSDVDRTKVTLLLNENQYVREYGGEYVAESGTQNGTQNGTQKKESNEDKIIKIIKNNSKTTRNEMSEKLGISIRTLQRIINASDKIRFVGSSKGGHWEVIE